jgi:hypothetical protein
MTHCIIMPIIKRVKMSSILTVYVYYNYLATIGPASIFNVNCKYDIGRCDIFPGTFLYFPRYLVYFQRYFLKKKDDIMFLED